MSTYISSYDPKYTRITKMEAGKLGTYAIHGDIVVDHRDDAAFFKEEAQRVIAEAAKYRWLREQAGEDFLGQLIKRHPGGWDSAIEREMKKSISF